MGAHSVSLTYLEALTGALSKPLSWAEVQLRSFPPLLGPPSSPEQSGEAATAFGLSARAPGKLWEKLPSR